MSKKPLDYSSAGVDYHRIDALKVRAQQAARATARHLSAYGASEIHASRGESAIVIDTGSVLIASIVECLGTKSLVADAVRPLSGRSHYDTIAQDTIALMKARNLPPAYGFINAKKLEGNPDAAEALKAWGKIEQAKPRPNR